MTLSIAPGPLRGEVRVLPSKSHLHRLLIAAALSPGETRVLRKGVDGADIQATMACLRAMGAEIQENHWGFLVRGISRQGGGGVLELPCGESGSTLRFLLPVLCTLGRAGRFSMEGRLPQRPMEPLLTALRAGGCSMEQTGDSLHVSGLLQAGDYSLPGDVSSQFISGLLFALPRLAGESRLRITGRLESAGYVAMTLTALREFGFIIYEQDDGFLIPGGQRGRALEQVTAQGDWSNGALWLLAGAMPGGEISLSGLMADSQQGDRAAETITRQLGAEVSWLGHVLHVQSANRRAVELDAGDIPDLIPAVAAVAAVAEGETIIRNAARLRLKESDRLTAVAETLNALGAQITVVGDSLRIQGTPQLRGGRVSARGDHRIAMMAALASCACREAVMVDGAQAVEKSDPQFWNTLKRLGKTIKEEVQP